MLKRHKILLGIFLEGPRVPTRTELMKWLFLLRQETCLISNSSFYDFVPYRYGPFSFTVYRDLEDFKRFGYLDGEGFTIQFRLIEKAKRSYQSLPSNIREAVKGIFKRYRDLSSSQLIKMIYEKYPWFASKSRPKTISEEKKRVAIYTTGYEGKSIDLFFQELLKVDIKRIIDVRNNPISRKYGFSKKTLYRLGENLGIKYTHFPELGIPTADRRFLSTFDDYQQLMHHYVRSILPKAEGIRKEATRLLQDQPSVLVCFEADPRCCHRTQLAQVISTETGMEVVHMNIRN